MERVLFSANVAGTISAPASKSSMQRACAAALIKKSNTRIFNAGISNDDKASLKVIEALGAKVYHLQDGIISIDSSGNNQKLHRKINFGESGLGIRMFTPIAALLNSTTTITGEGSLLSRPMEFFDEVLPKLSVQVKSNNGKLPLELSGKLVPVNIEIDGSLSSQFLTGLLFAYSSADAQDVSIFVKNLNSKPYIDLTLKVLQHFDLKVPENKNYKEFYFPKSSFSLGRSVGEEVLRRGGEEVDYTVEGDWSGASFLLVAGAIAGNLKVTGLDVQSTQADKKILEALMDSGAKVSLNDEFIEVANAPLKAFQFDATDCPDLFPPLVALASFCEGKSAIKGVHRLAHKESNRAKTLKEEFGKLGVNITFHDDWMIVEGVKSVNTAVVHSHNDHRIAMACGVAALRGNGPVTIENAEAVNKSYPAFYEDLKLISG